MSTTLAVGRRKRLASGSCPTSLTTVYTAPTAPTDGSAAAIGTLTICNSNASAQTVSVYVAGVAYIYNGYSIPANDTLVHNMDIDLQGGETLQIIASTTGLYYNFTGTVVSDT